MNDWWMSFFYWIWKKSRLKLWFVFVVKLNLAGEKFEYFVTTPMYEVTWAVIITIETNPCIFYHLNATLGLVVIRIYCLITTWQTSSKVKYQMKRIKPSRNTVQLTDLFWKNSITAQPVGLTSSDKFIARPFYVMR